MASHPTESPDVPVVADDEVQVIKIRITTPAKAELKLNVRPLLSQSPISSFYVVQAEFSPRGTEHSGLELCHFLFVFNFLIPPFLF